MENFGIDIDYQDGDGNIGGERITCACEWQRRAGGWAGGGWKSNKDNQSQQSARPGVLQPCNRRIRGQAYPQELLGRHAQVGELGGEGGLVDAAEVGDVADTLPV